MPINPKPKLLIFTDWFVPGYKGGGPIRSVANLTEVLKEDYNIFILTQDTDFGNKKPYDNIESDSWLDYTQNTKVFYLSKNKLTYQNIQEQVKAIQADFIYLNSMFSLYFAIMPLLIKWRNPELGKMILAPRGMLHKGAIQFKRFKKSLFLNLLKIIRIPKKIYFHATDNQENLDIQKHLSVNESKIVILENFPFTEQKPFKTCPKEKGKLKCIFISRISPKKNLDYFLTILKEVEQEIIFSIVGPIEDKAYWEDCQTIIKTLPSNIAVTLLGEMPHHQIINVLEKHHVFVLPTKGENFGHVVFESFVAGRPVIISDQTPWTNLKEQQIGWDIQLSEPHNFVRAIEDMAQMPQTDFDNWCKKAFNFASNYSTKSNLKEKYLRLFS